jgi:hypothetical protein
VNDPADRTEDEKAELLHKVAKRLRRHADRTKAAILPIGAKLVSLRSMTKRPRLPQFRRGGTPLSAAKGVSCEPTMPVVAQGAPPNASRDHSEAILQNSDRFQDRRVAMDPDPVATINPSNARASEPVPSPGQPGEPTKKLPAARTPPAAAGAGLGEPFRELQTTQSEGAEGTMRLRDLLEGGIRSEIRHFPTLAQEQLKGQPGRTCGQLAGSASGGTRIPDNGAVANSSSGARAVEFAKQRPAVDPDSAATINPSNGRASESVPSPEQPGEQPFDAAGSQNIAGKYRRGLARLAADASHDGEPFTPIAKFHQGALRIGAQGSPDMENEGLGEAIKKLQPARSPLAAASAGLGGSFRERQTTQAGWAEGTTRLRNLLEGGISPEIRRFPTLAQEQLKGQPEPFCGQLAGSADGGTRIPDSGAGANSSSETRGTDFAKQSLDEAKQLNRTQSQMLDWFKQNFTGRPNKEPATAG